MSENLPSIVPCLTLENFTNTLKKENVDSQIIALVQDIIDQLPAIEAMSISCFDTRLALERLSAVPEIRLKFETFFRDKLPLSPTDLIRKPSPPVLRLLKKV